jgi:hypothetical protein
MKIRGKLTTLSLLFGVVPLLLAATAAYLSASGALDRAVQDRLGSIRDAKKQQIELYFAKIREQVLTFSGNLMIGEAMQEHGLQGAELLIVGDGPVEIQAGRERNALTLGVASDEVHRTGWNDQKQARLEKADAHALIPDFTELDEIFQFIFPEG